MAEAAGAWLPCIATLASCLLGFVLYFYAPYWGVRGVPGPPALPIVGHLPLLARHGPDVFAALAKKYGPIFRFHLGRQPLVIVADPELCKEVGIRQFKSIPNRSLPSPIAGSALHQKGLFFTRDARWSAMRNTIISLYQPSHLAGLVPTMQRCVERAADTVQSAAGEHGDGEFDFSDLALKLATDVIGQAAFGVDFALSAPHDGGGEAAEFVAEHVHSTTSLKMDLSARRRSARLLLPPSTEQCSNIPPVVTMENEEGRMVDLYVPRKCSATNRIITAKDHASVQINIGHVDENGLYDGRFTTFALSGFVRGQGDADGALDRLWQQKRAEIKQ